MIERIGACEIMTAQEKQETLLKLRTVIPLFQEFEGSLYAAQTFSKLKKEAIRNSVPVVGPLMEFTEFMDNLKPLTDTVEPLRNARAKANAVADSAISAGVSITAMVMASIIMIIPSIIAGAMVSAIITAILRPILWPIFGQRISSVIMGLTLAAAIIIEIIGTKRLSRFIRRKTQKVTNALDSQIAFAEQKCEAVRQQVSQLDMSWYPPDYCCSDAANFFYKAINNNMCGTLGEAVVLYEQKLFQDQVLANQQKQISLAYEQCILQRQPLGAVVAEGEAIQGAIHAEGAAGRQQREEIYKDFIRRTGL